MYRKNIENRICIKCKRKSEHQRGTLAMKNPSYGKCPYCGGETELDIAANEERKKRIQERMEKLYSNTAHLKPLK